MSCTYTDTHIRLISRDPHQRDIHRLQYQYSSPIRSFRHFPACRASHKTQNELFWRHHHGQRRTQSWLVKAQKVADEAPEIVEREQGEKLSNGSQNGGSSETLSPSPEGSNSSLGPVWRWEESGDAVGAYVALFTVLAIGAIPALQSVRLADLPYFVSLAALTIYIGAHRGLSTKLRQQISIREGLLAPIFASVSLFAVYLLLQQVPQQALLTFFDAYFWLIGGTAVIGALGPSLRKAGDAIGQPSLKVPVPDGLLLDATTGKSLSTADITPSDILALTLAIAAATGDFAAHHSNFTLNNLLACAIVTDILQLLGLRSFRTAAVLLVGLLLYDVFWVFASPAAVGENVMLAVATSDVFTGPTRLIFPRIPGSMGEASSYPFSLLGLGDIAVPGLLACLALRYDASRVTDMGARATAAADALQGAIASAEKGATDGEVARAAASAAEAAFDSVADREVEVRQATQSGSGGSAGPSLDSNHVPEAVLDQRTYFIPVMVGYVGGLGMAFLANMVTHLGQPALLYLVPCTLSAVGITALLRGETERVINFQDTSSRSLLAAVEDSKKE